MQLHKTHRLPITSIPKMGLSAESCASGVVCTTKPTPGIPQATMTRRTNQRRAANNTSEFPAKNPTTLNTSSAMTLTSKSPDEIGCINTVTTAAAPIIASGWTMGR